MKEKKTRKKTVTIPKHLQGEMLRFFMRTSMPRIAESKRKKAAYKK